MINFNGLYIKKYCLITVFLLIMFSFGLSGDANASTTSEDTIQASTIVNNIAADESQPNTYDNVMVPPAPTILNGTYCNLDESNRIRVILNWPAVEGAMGYKLWIFDGNAYRAFDVGNVTSWDSSEAKIYPDDNWLINQADGSISSDPFNHEEIGLDLSDEPSLLYQKTKGAFNYDANRYWFALSTYNTSGDSGMGSANYTFATPHN